jgi:UDP-N-acetylglucosamine:LPS N-acetylglucosamine transferase
MRMWLENNVHMHRYVTIIHQIGHQDYTDWNALYKQYDISVQVFDFCDTMQQVYQQAHLAISRAGAGSLFELLYFNVPSLIIPLQTASTTHQKNNAYAMASEYPALFTVMEEAIIFMKPVSFYDYINAAIYAHISKHSVLAEELHQDRHDMTSFVP